ncbi:hypothetical protein WN943_005444 [Citrus x changshan-huyou]
MATSMLLPLDIIVDLLIRLTSEESATIQVRSEVIPFGNQRPRFHQTPISIGSVETNSDRSLFLSVLNRGKWEWERRYESSNLAGDADNNYLIAAFDLKSDEFY